MTDGWHGPQTLRELVAWGRGRLERNWDFVWAAVGEPGSGKSGLQLQIATDLQAPTPLVIPDQIVWQVKDIPFAARRLPKFRAIVADEKRKGGSKRRALSKENVENLEFLETCRANNQAIGFTNPEWDGFDAPIQERVQWLLEVRGRGHGVAYQMIHSGRPGNRKHYPLERFPFTFHDTAEIAPDVWKEYLAFKGDFLAGKQTDGLAQERLLEDRMVQAIHGIVETQTIVQRRARPRRS